MEITQEKPSIDFALLPEGVKNKITEIESKGEKIIHISKINGDYCIQLASKTRKITFICKCG